MSVTNKDLIIIAGPTCTGKSAAAVETALKINGEIVSGDSVQVYKGLDIGSAKVTNEEMKGIKHYMLDLVEPTFDYNISLFQEEARKSIAEIHNKNKMPILAGGTGFYIRAITKDNVFTDNAVDLNLRNRLLKEMDENPEKLYKDLQEKDPEYALKTDINNKKRVVRALEYFYSTGEKLSDHNEKEKEKEDYYNNFFFVLYDDRETMYERINKRVDEMVETGLIEEVEAVLNKGCNEKSLSMQAIGYKEVIPYIKGLYDKETMLETLKKNTRHLAKRQLTWFKHQEKALWIPVHEYDYDFDRISDKIIKEVKERK